MGLDLPEIWAVEKLRRKGYFTGSPLLVDIGAQQMSGSMFGDKSWIGACADAFNVAPRDFQGVRSGVMAHGDREALSPDAPLAADLWRWLNFDYRAVDLDGSPGAIPLDLNVDPCPPDLLGKAALVMNSGTTEHICNQYNAFKVMHDMTAVSGIMIHTLPCQGYLTHGLVNYTPKFFWALAAANAYMWEDFMLIQSPVTYPTPSDVMGEAIKLGREEGMDKYRFTDAEIFVVLRKIIDIPFVAPIDVATGSTTDIPELKERYWTIFDDQRLQDMLIAQAKAKNDA